MRKQIRHITEKIKHTERSGILLAAAILLLVMMGRWYKQELPVRKIKLHVTNTSLKQRLISKSDIAKVLLNIQRDGITNLKVKDIDFRALEQGLERHPSIREAEVFLDMTNVLHIDVTQRIPIARIIDTNGTQYYMDTEGYRVPLSPHCSYRVPVVSGMLPVTDVHAGERPEEDIYLKLHRLLGALHRDTLLQSLIEQLYVDAHNEITMIPKAGYKRIIFGKPEDMEQKLKKLKKFYKKGDWGKYDTIDLEFKNIVIARTDLETS